MNTINKVEPCPSCGSYKIRYKGTRKRKQKLYNCLDCGFSWPDRVSIQPTRIDYAENKRMF
jgi:transposase-like protein